MTLHKRNGRVRDEVLVLAMSLNEVFVAGRKALDDNRHAVEKAKK